MYGTYLLTYDLQKNSYLIYVLAMYCMTMYNIKNNNNIVGLNKPVVFLHAHVWEPQLRLAHQYQISWFIVGSLRLYGPYGSDNKLLDVQYYVRPHVGTG